MKKTTPMVERDGKNWWWCPKHVIPGRYDGLYVTHKPEDHEEWVQKKEVRKAKFVKERKNDGNGPKDDSEGTNKKLALTDTLKAALLTRCDLTGAQADALIREAQDEADF